MTNKLLVANWKANKNSIEAANWLDDFLGVQKLENRQYVICPPFVHLPFLLPALETNIALGVQDLSPYGAGAYTGEIAGANLVDLGISYAILGHSERRKYFKETDELIATKAKQTLDAEITPIICVDKEQIQSQFDALDKNVRNNTIIAYEPVHAISTFGGQEDPIETTLQIIEQIHVIFGDNTQVLYGGSVNPENSITYLTQESIAGALVGSASLDPQTFARL